MRRILIFGNSSSGKSTLAKKLAREWSLAHFDLDIIAWLPTVPPQRELLENSIFKINEFVESNNNWVIEGCYTDLLEIVASKANEAIFLNLSVEQCIQNARNRPWEPHKYNSKEEQDSNLDMLIGWIEQYNERKDVFSFEAHHKLYKNFNGSKRMLT